MNVSGVAGGGRPVLQACDLDVSIAGQEVCRGLELALGPGEMVGVLGRNGVGKTTLLLTLAGLRTPGGGEVWLDGAPISRMPRRSVARRLGILFQEDGESFPTTVMETALIGRHPHVGPWRWESEEDRRIAAGALERLGLGGLGERPVDTLSGGERRRLAIATMLAQAPRAWLLDEPTNHLDMHHQIEVLDLLRAHAQDTGSGMLAVLHDVNLAARFCNRLLMLFGDGDVALGATADVLTEASLAQLYRHGVVRLRDAGHVAFVPR